MNIDARAPGGYLIQSLLEKERLVKEIGINRAAEALGIKSNTLKRDLRRLNQWRDLADEYRKIWDKINIPDHSKYPHISGDVLIVSDLHIPYTDVNLLATATAVAGMFSIKKMVSVGDFFDFERLSKFDFGADVTTPAQDLYMGSTLLSKLRKQFSEIWLLRGNHDERLIKFLKTIKRMYETHPELAEYSGIIGTDMSKTAWEQYKEFLEMDGVHVSNHPKALIDNKFLVVHPSSYSMVPGNVEERIVQKYWKHVIGTHGHDSCLRFDRSGMFIVGRIGGLVDANKIFYKQMRVTTHPEWVNGFAWTYKWCG